MHIVIVGGGKLGLALTAQLLRENHDIVLVDNDPRVISEAQLSMDVMTVLGNGASLEIQREADVGHRDLLIAVTSTDELNLLACVLAKKLGCKHAIARIRTSEYLSQIGFLREELGLSMVINPELNAAREIYRMVQFPSFLKRESFARSRVELVELKLEKDSVLVGRQLNKLYDFLKMKILVCAVERQNEIIIPRGDFIFKEGDKINVTAPRSDLAKLIKKLDIAAQKIKNVIIIGGSRIAAFLADELLHSGINVKIIEHSEERCQKLSENLPGALIICGDGTLQELLLEENIKNTDAVITLTDIDEENLVISMYAEHLGVPKTITKMNRTEYGTLFRDRGIGSVVCPKDLATSEIIRYVRAMDNTTGDSVLTLHRIVDSKAEALEFEIPLGFKWADIPLSQLPMKKNLLLACINRGGKIIVPQGSDVLLPRDIVIVVTAADQQLSDFGDVFEDE